MKNGKPSVTRKRLAAWGSGWHGRVVFSTGDVAKICGVSPRTVSAWIDTGQLEGHRLPSHVPGQPGNRRVSREELLRFARRHGMTPALVALGGDAGRGVLLVGCNGLGERLAPFVEGVAVRSEGDAFAAGRAFADGRPAAVVIDVSALGYEQSVLLLRSLRQRSWCVALAPEDWSSDRLAALTAAGAAAVIQPPVDAATLAKLLMQG